MDYAGALRGVLKNVFLQNPARWTRAFEVLQNPARWTCAFEVLENPARWTRAFGGSQGSNGALYAVSGHVTVRKTYFGVSKSDFGRIYREKSPLRWVVVFFLSFFLASRHSLGCVSKNAFRVWLVRRNVCRDSFMG